MVKKSNLHIGMIIILIIIISIGLICLSVYAKSIMEVFEQPGKYPISVDRPLLYKNYNVSQNPGISTNGAEQNYVNDPVFPAHSCINNNIRYWRRPTNGLCSAPDFCGNLYTNTEPNIPDSAVAPEWDTGVRVNFFDSELETCN